MGGVSPEESAVHHLTFPVDWHHHVLGEGRRGEEEEEKEERGGGGGEEERKRKGSRASGISKMVMGHSQLSP